MKYIKRKIYLARESVSYLIFIYITFNILKIDRLSLFIKIH